MSVDRQPTDLVGHLVRLRQALVDHPLLVQAPGLTESARSRDELIQQLDDYVIPRLLNMDAPLLTVVGGSTGAGKSTLVNSIVGQRVSESGVLRPTTRSPVLVHHPDDADWFTDDSLLPGLERTRHASSDHEALQLVATDRLPAGLAVLDAPDVDSVELSNRELATQLLASADLWLFVTSAARYADQVPWEFLQTAAQRSTAVAVVLDRTRPGSVREVSSHLARMMNARGLGDSPLLTVPESPVNSDGLLPDSAVTEIRGWLRGLASDAHARTEVVRRTLDGAIASIGPRARKISDALAEQAELATRMDEAVAGAYAEGLAEIDRATQDGTLLRGEVLARWQEFVGTGEMLKGLEERVSRVRDRFMNAAKGRPQPAQRLHVAVESGLETLVLEAAEASAERAVRGLRDIPGGEAVLAEAPADAGRVSRDFRSRVQRMVRDWQQGVLDMVRSEGADKRSTARFLAYGVNGLGVALMVVVFSATAGLTGAEVGVAGGTAVLGQKILEAVFGDQAVRRLADNARADLNRRIGELMEAEQDRLGSIVTGLTTDPGASQRVLDLTRAVEDARYRAKEMDT